MTGARPRVAGIVRDALLVAVVAALVFQGLRRCVADRYAIPTGSMQPLLYGARDGGDVVLVDKLVSVTSLQRYDLVAIQHPREPGVQVVKRVVAFGDEPDACWVDLREGDLWLGPDAQRLERAQKPPLRSRELRATWFCWPIPGDDQLDQFLRAHTADGALLLLPAGSPEQARAACTPAALAGRAERGLPLADPGWLGTVRAVDGSFLDARGGRRLQGGEVEVLDVGLDFEVDLTDVTDLYCCLELRPDIWLFHWDPGRGQLELWRNGATVAQREVPGPTAGGGATRIEYGFLDGRFFWARGGRDAWCIERTAAWTTPDPGPAPWALPRTRLSVGVRATRPVAVPRLTVFRDVHWFRQRQPGAAVAATARYVPAGHLYLLGDNAFASQDSRSYGPVPAAGMIGRPRLLLGPWPRGPRPL